MGLLWRLSIAIMVFVLSLVYALPSVPYLGTALERVLPSSKINLGLDLKGGIHLTLGVDVAKAVSNSLALVGQDLRRVAEDEKIVVLRPRVVGGTALEFVLPRADNEPKFRELLAKQFPQLSVGEPQAGEAGQLRYVARFTPAEVKRIEDLSLDQALRTIRNRIDQFGVAEPDIRKQAGNRIQVQLPGISDPRRAVQVIGQTAHLEFHMVREDVDPGKAVLPPGVIVLPMLEKNPGQQQKETLIALEKEGRHRYYRLAGHDVAELLESLMGVAFRTGAVRLRSSPREPALRHARTCYDHLAGERAVAVYEALLNAGILQKDELDALALTAPGADWLKSWGLDAAALAPHSRRPLCRTCVDWSERRPHISGALGAAIADTFFKRGWAERLRRSRTVRYFVNALQVVIPVSGLANLQIGERLSCAFSTHQDHVGNVVREVFTQVA